MKKKFILPVGLLFAIVLTSCKKGEINYYDDDADVTRDYTLTFDHIEVVAEEASANVNGLLDVDEIAVLNVYLHNSGPDPCLLSYGTWGITETAATNGFYVFNHNIEDVEMGSTASAGYKVQYIDPGGTDYVSVKVRAYDWLDPNQDIQGFFDFIDYDDGARHVDFTIHVE
jgi:hypothetical protein